MQPAAYIFCIGNKIFKRVHPTMHQAESYTPHLHFAQILTTLSVARFADSIAIRHCGILHLSVSLVSQFRASAMLLPLTALKV